MITACKELHKNIELGLKPLPVVEDHLLQERLAIKCLGAEVSSVEIFLFSQRPMFNLKAWGPLCFTI